MDNHLSSWPSNRSYKRGIFRTLKKLEGLKKLKTTETLPVLVYAVSTPGGMMPPLTPSSPYGGSCVGGAGLLHNLDTEGQIFVPRQMLLMARVRDHPFMMLPVLGNRDILVQILIR
jgi:hypothetical protein